MEALNNAPKADEKGGGFFHRLMHPLPLRVRPGSLLARDGMIPVRIAVWLLCAIWWVAIRPIRLVIALIGRWRHRKYRRMRDIPLRASFVVYTLVAFLIGMLICLVVIQITGRVRANIDRAYKDSAVTYIVPDGGRFEVEREGTLSTFKIYSERRRRMEKVVIDLTEQRVNYEVDPEDLLGLSHNGFTVLPKYTPEENFTNILMIAISVAVVPVVSIIALIICSVLFFRRKLKRPMDLLSQGSEHIAQNDLDFEISYDSQNEMGQLCRSFETMRSALEQNNRQMWRSMEERKRLNAAFSHDLRTPLTVLKGHTAMLQEGAADGSLSADEIDGELRAMSGSIDRLERYVDAMARLQRLEDVEIHRRETPFEALAESLRDTAQILCQAKGMALRFEVWPGEKDTVNVDAEIVQQVFENLLANGVRYARSALGIRVRTTANELSIRVVDDGPGFSEAALSKATEAFFRDKSAADSESHLGLGLNICKVLCGRHRGALTVANARSGGGSVTATFGL